MGFIDTVDRSGMIVSFESVVEKTVSQVQIDEITLITRIGGIIGVGKNLLWILIFIITSLTSGVSILKSYYCVSNSKN